jgi:hypothetical protein
MHQSMWASRTISNNNIFFLKDDEHFSSSPYSSDLDKVLAFCQFLFPVKARGPPGMVRLDSEGIRPGRQVAGTLFAGDSFSDDCLFHSCRTGLTWLGGQC